MGHGISKITLSVADAAAATGLSQKALRRRIERGTLPSVLVGGSRQIPLVDLVDAGLMTTAPPPAPVVPPPPRTQAADDRPVPDISMEFVTALLDRLERVVAENERLRIAIRHAQRARVDEPV